LSPGSLRVFGHFDQTRRITGNATPNKADRTLDSPVPESGPQIFTPYRNSKHRLRTEEERELNRQLASVPMWSTRFAW